MIVSKLQQNRINLHRISKKLFQKKYLVMLMALVLMSVSKQALAVPLAIVGPSHNGVFHTSIRGGSSGHTLAWLKLDNSEENTYDPDSGDLHAHFKVFKKSRNGRRGLIGRVTALGTLPSSNFQHDGGVAGSITWSFDYLKKRNFLSRYLGGVDVITVNYLDYLYGSSGGRPVNGWSGNELNLWGSGSFEKQSRRRCWGGQHCEPSYAFLGNDLKIKVSDMPVTGVPEPLSLILMGSGLAGIVRARRRKVL